jgi:integrase
MKESKLIKCPRTGLNRTLYSLRHTYATFALINDGMDIHALAIQMGTSIGMIERHYSPSYTTAQERHAHGQTI